MSQCLSICVLSRNSVLQSIQLSSVMNPTFTPGNRMVTEICERNVWNSQQERFPHYLNQINAPLLAYRLVLYIIILPYFLLERSNRRVETKGFQFLVRFLRKNRSYVLFFSNQLRLPYLNLMLSS